MNFVLLRGLQLYRQHSAYSSQGHFVVVEWLLMLRRSKNDRCSGPSRGLKQTGVRIFADKVMVKKRGGGSRLFQRLGIDCRPLTPPELPYLLVANPRHSLATFVSIALLLPESSVAVPEVWDLSCAQSMLKPWSTCHTFAPVMDQSSPKSGDVWEQGSAVSGPG